MAGKNEKLAGGCACGAIRYSSTAESGFSFLCQCTHCQQASGGGHSAAFILQQEAFAYTGDMSWYDRKSDSGNTISRGFCGACGSPVVNKNSGHSHIVFVSAATLDNPDEFKPEKVFFREHGREWDLKDPGSTF